MTTPNRMLPLRGYQEEGLDAIEACWARGVRRLAVVWPTGAGKTVGFAHLAARWRARNRSRVLVLAHRHELIEQAADKLKGIAPHLSIGIVKASRREVHADVVVGSVQSLRSDTALSQLTHVGLIVVDECHHATASTYRKILTYYGALDPDGICDPSEHALAVGFTATLARGDDENLGEIWQEVAHRKDILWMIRRKYLLDVYAKRVQVDDLNLSGVRVSRGDYSEKDLGEAMMESLAPELAAQAYLEHAKDRSGVLFAPTVESAYAFNEAMTEIGIKAEVVHGAMPAAERSAIFARCHDGTTQVLSNCMVATEGTDVPRWSCAVIARPTKSSPLYQQMVGRILRPFAGQGPGQPIEKALVLDVTGVTGRHTLASLIDLTGQKYREPVKADESLLEHDEYEEALAERGEATGEGLAWEYATGPTVVTEVDLFAESRQRWTQTAGGTWFAPAGKDHLVFLAPAHGPDRAGTYAVCWAHKAQRKGGYVQDDTGQVHRGLELGYAMGWGEDAIAQIALNSGDITGTYSRKDASWRQYGKASDAQKRFARSLGITFDDDIKKGEIGDLITHVIGSRRIDPIVKRMQGGRS